MIKFKKSQISLFILIGLVILIAAVFVIYVKNIGVEEKRDVEKSIQTFDLQPIKLFVESCIKDTAKEGIIFVGKQGGYFNIPRPYLKDNNFNLPYYFYENLDFVPSINNIEKEISSYINNNLPICINNFDEFEKLGFDINQEIINSNTRIEKNSISFNINFPLTVFKNNIIQKIENFVTRIENVPLRNINNVSREIINLQIQDKNSVCLSCLYDLGGKNNLYIDIREYLNNTLIFDIRAYNTNIITPKDAPYNFTFAIKYEGISCDNLAAIDDFIFLIECLEAKKREFSNEIVIEGIPNFEIKISEEFFYDINATGKNLIFEDFTNLFEIGRLDGIIRFIPKAEQVGLHQIWLRAFDLVGNEDYENFEINITK